MKIVKVTRVITYTGPEDIVATISSIPLTPSIPIDALLKVKIKDSIIGIPQVVTEDSKAK